MQWTSGKVIHKFSTHCKQPWTSGCVSQNMRPSKSVSRGHADVPFTRTACRHSRTLSPGYLGYPDSWKVRIIKPNVQHQSIHFSRRYAPKTIFTFPPLVALTFWRQNCSASYADVGKFYLCTGQTGGWGVTRMRPSRVGPHNKLLTCCVPTETQPPSISETRNEKAYCRWLGRWYVCMLHYESSVYEWLRNTASAY